MVLRLGGRLDARKIAGRAGLTGKPEPLPSLPDLAASPPPGHDYQPGDGMARCPCGWKQYGRGSALRRGYLEHLKQASRGEVTMAGKRTAREPFEGETWSDETGTTYELIHDARRVQVRFLNDGGVRFSTKGAPLMMEYVVLGNRPPAEWATIELKATA
jgi:hypothetical protein